MRSPLKIAFQPPSDMGTTGSGGGNKIWKILGIGCGILVLIFGIGLAVGGYKVASFCGSGIDIVKTAMNAQKYGGKFANDIAKPDFDKAYGKMSPRYQGEVTKVDFIAQFAKYKDAIEGGTPVARGFNANQTDTKDEYKASYFFTSSGSEMPTIKFTIIKGNEEGNDSFLVDTFEIFLAERSMEKEQPGQMVLQFHNHISRGQDAIAYMSMGDTFRSKTGQEAFDQFLKDAGPSFTTGRWEIRNIKYHTADSATVMIISRSQGNSMLVQFEMARTEKMGIPVWQIEAIAPLVAGEAPTDAKVTDDSANKKAEDVVEIPKIDKPAENPTENPTQK